jgi:hypothetical protein
MAELTRILDTIVPDHFRSPIDHTEYTLVRSIIQLHPGMQHIVSTENIPLSGYLKAQGVPTKLTDQLRSYHFDHLKDEVTSSVKIGLSEFQWSDVDFIVYKFTWSDVAGLHVMYILLFHGVGEDDTKKRKVGEDLLNCAYKWNLGLKDEIFVFSDGQWFKDKNLWSSIQSANWDSLVLDADFKAGLKRDTETFFSSREIYSSLGIPWKRGLLLLGRAVLSNLIIFEAYFWRITLNRSARKWQNRIHQGVVEGKWHTLSLCQIIQYKSSMFTLTIVLLLVH